jgi:hypothetical protein
MQIIAPGILEISMTNPFDPSYLAAASATLGPFAWAFLALQAAGIGAGLYLRFGRKDSNPLRKHLVSRLGLALLVVGGIGILLGVLRASDVAVFSQRYWFYLLLLVELGLAGYVAYYARSVYPRRLAAQQQASRGRGSARRSTLRTQSSSVTAGTNGRDHGDHAEPAHSSSRRESRQRRKRKQRR